MILDMKFSATISDCGRFRMELRRTWDETKPLLVVCMLNPSTADAHDNDPTLWRVIHFAFEWGYGGVVVINLFTLRSPKPAVLVATAERDHHLYQMYWERALDICEQTKKPVLAAWGNDGFLHSRDQAFIARCRARKIEMVCLGFTSSRQPKHPLARGKSRAPNNQQPLVFRGFNVQ